MKLMMLTKTTNESASTFGRATWRRVFHALTLSSVVILTASTAQAIHVDLAADAPPSDIDFTVSTHSVSTQIKIGIYGGGTFNHASTVNVIEFAQPVVLNSVNFDGFGRGGVAFGPDGHWVIELGTSFEARTVSRIELIAWRLAGVAKAAMAIDIDAPGAPSQAIPEPGAALLFGAGLVTVGLARRRAERG